MRDHRFGQYKFERLLGFQLGKPMADHLPFERHQQNLKACKSQGYHERHPHVLLIDFLLFQ